MHDPYKTEAALQGRKCNYLMHFQDITEIEPVNCPAQDYVDCSRLNFAPDVFTQFFDSSRASLRWRRLISPLAAVTRKPAVLSPSSFRRSISSIISWGILTVVICDFAFFAPVAITEAPYVRCISVYAKKRIRKGLRCISLWASFKSESDIHLSHLKPGSVGALTGPLTKQLIGVTVMADKQHTQTRPKFTWLFLAIPKGCPECTPVVLRFDADSEEAARGAFPDMDMIFAAKIRSSAPCRLAFFDYTSRSGCAFDSALSQEVIGYD